MTSARSQRGIALVEFAIVAPLLLFLMLAVAEFGRAFVQYTVLANSARDAARYLAGKAFDDTTGIIKVSSGLKDETKNLAVYGNTAATGSPLLPAYKVDQVTVASDVDDGSVSVTVLYPYQAMLGASLPAFGLGGSDVSLKFNMHVVVVMRAI